MRSGQLKEVLEEAVRADLAVAVEGLVTLRCYKRLEWFKERVDEAIQKSINVEYCAAACSCWTSFRQDMAVAVLVAAYACLAIGFRDTVAHVNLIFSL